MFFKNIEKCRSSIFSLLNIESKVEFRDTSVGKYMDRKQESPQSNGNN